MISETGFVGTCSLGRLRFPSPHVAQTPRRSIRLDASLRRRCVPPVRPGVSSALQGQVFAMVELRLLDAVDLRYAARLPSAQQSRGTRVLDRVGARPAACWGHRSRSELWSLVTPTDSAAVRQGILCTAAESLPCSNVERAQKTAAPSRTPLSRSRLHGGGGNRTLVLHGIFHSVYVRSSPIDFSGSRVVSAQLQDEPSKVSRADRRRACALSRICDT